MLAVRWYLRYGLSYRDVEERLAERGITLDHVAVYRWVQRFTPLLIETAHSTEVARDQAFNSRDRRPERGSPGSSALRMPDGEDVGHEQSGVADRQSPLQRAIDDGW